MIHRNKTIPSKIISIMLVLVFILGTFLGSIGTAVAESNLENGTHKVEVKALKESEDTVEDNIDPYIDGIGEVEVNNSISFAYITINDTSQLKSIKVRTEGAISPGPDDEVRTIGAISGPGHEVRTDVAIYTEPEIVEEDPGLNTRTYKFEIEDVDNAVDSVGYTHDDQKIWFRLKLAIIDENAEYTVTFDSDGGTDVAPIKAKWNETINEQEPPQKNNRVFDGWYNGEQKIEFPMAVTGDITLKAHWREFYTVFYYTNGGGYKKQLDNDLIIYHTSRKEGLDSDFLIPFEAPIRSGYNFLGWYVIKNDQDVPTQEDNMIDPEKFDGYPLEAVLENGQIQISAFEENIPSNKPENREIRCYARWETEGNEIPKYTVTFDTQGGTPIDDQILDGDTALIKRTIETSSLKTEKDGYEATWLYNDNIIKQKIYIIEDTTLTAHWDKLYTTTLDANGGVVFNIQSEKYEEIANIEMASGSGRTYTSGLRKPERRGYIFKGWYDEEGYLFTDITIIPPRDVTLTARWSKDTPADGQYNIDINVWQEFKDEDSMASQFFDKEDALLEVIDSKIYLTTTVHTEGEFGGVKETDIIKSLEQRMSDGTFKNLELVPVEGEKKVKIKIEYPNMNEAVFLRCTVKPMGDDFKPLLRVILKYDTLEEVPQLIEEGNYLVDVDIFREMADIPSMSAPFFDKEDLSFKVKDGKMFLTLRVSRNGEFGGVYYTDVIEWLKQSIGDDLKLLTLKDIGEGKVETELEFTNTKTPALVQVKVKPMGDSTPYLRVAIKEGSLRKDLATPEDGDYKANIAIDGQSQATYKAILDQQVVGLPLEIKDGKIYLTLISKAISPSFNPEVFLFYRLSSDQETAIPYTLVIDEEGVERAHYKLDFGRMTETADIQIKMITGYNFSPVSISFELTPKYTVIFNSDGGSVVESKTEYENTFISEPEVPTKENMIFLDWYNGNDKVTFPIILVEDLTLKAHWTAVKVAAKDVLKDGDTTTNGSLRVIVDGDIIYEYSIDGQNWQQDNTFLNLEAGDYIVSVRDKDNPTNAATKEVTIKTVEVLKPTVVDGKTTITEEDLNKDYVQINLDDETVTEMTVQMPSANKETAIKIASGTNLPKIKVVKANQLTLEIPEGTSYQTDNEVLQLPKLIEDTEAIIAAIEDLEGSSKDISNVVAISVGGENSVTFGDYVMMTLNGKSGKECVFIDESGVAQPIKKVSKNAASTETGDQYCYDDGSNLIIKTKHFTEFVTYEAKTNDGGGNGGGSNDSYSWDKDGDYSVDIDVLQEHKNSSSMARPFFETKNLPVEIDDGKITLAIKVNKDGNMNGYKYTDVIEEFYQKINGKYKKLNLKYLNNDDVRYITTEIEFDDPDEEAFIRVHITPMLPSTPALRIKLKKNTLGDEDDAIDLEPDEGDKQTNIEGQEIISGAITIRKNAKDLKFVNGYKDKTFRPDHNINRAEVLSMLDKITELGDDVDKKDVNFKDMDMWAKESIEKFAQGGIIEGYQDGTIKPNGEMTRAEFSKIIAMVMGLEIKDEAADLKDIADHWAEKYINALVKKGYMKGYEDKTFKPNNKITRAEVVTVINRIIGSSAQDYMVNNNPFTDIDASHWAYKDVMKAVNE